jgi:L-aminopeptidase/D-esterase-like protein
LNNCITDVYGIKVGQESDLQGMTGCTVVLCEEGAVCGVDVRGGAPGTRETDLLSPINLVDKVHAVLLAGGSAFGLDAASGIMEYLEERGKGFDVGITKVPIVPGAVLFDLYTGDWRARPDKKMGYSACLSAASTKICEGNAGAGTGATVGKVYGIERAMKGGIASASIKVGNLIVGGIVAVNAFGDVINPETGGIIAGALDEERKNFVDTIRVLGNGLGSPFSNTTIGVVATNGRFSKSSMNKIAQMAQNGLAKTIRPCHTMYDGDTIFALATGEVEGDINLVGYLAAEVVAQCVLTAVKTANK